MTALEARCLAIENEMHDIFCRIRECAMHGEVQIQFPSLRKFTDSQIENLRNLGYVVKVTDFGHVIVSWEGA